MFLWMNKKCRKQNVIAYSKNFFPTRVIINYRLYVLGLFNSQIWAVPSLKNISAKTMHLLEKNVWKFLRNIDIIKNNSFLWQELFTFKLEGNVPYSKLYIIIFWDTGSAQDLNQNYIFYKHLTTHNLGFKTTEYSYIYNHK